MVIISPLKSALGITSMPAIQSRSFEGLIHLNKSSFSLSDGNSGPSSVAVCACCCLSILQPADNTSQQSNPTGKNT